MTNMRDWTTDDLINGLWSAEIYTRCQCAFELGRRHDTENLKIILAVEIKPRQRASQDQSVGRQYVPQEERQARDRRRRLINQDYDSPEALLQTIFTHGDENMRCMTLCAAAGLGAAGYALIHTISSYQWTRDAYLVIALDVCPPDMMALFTDYIYEKLSGSRWSGGFINLLYRRGVFGIQMLVLALSMGNADRRLNVINGLEYCQGWSAHDGLVYEVVHCLYDNDLRVAKNAIKLLRHARAGTAVPYLIPFLTHKTLSKTAFGALRIIDTVEAQQAIRRWQTAS
jgi:hypothetical protein